MKTLQMSSAEQDNILNMPTETEVKSEIPVFCMYTKEYTDENGRKTTHRFGCVYGDTPTSRVLTRFLSGNLGEILAIVAIIVGIVHIIDMLIKFCYLPPTVHIIAAVVLIAIFIYVNRNELWKILKRGA